MLLMNRNARPTNNQLITYFLHVCYLLRIQQYPVNTTYNTESQMVQKAAIELSGF